ncbi:uncharacterized protein LOC120627055 [Pararge aegeria]|uniref:uncharacterized protein LOC120627055 n=1 Tax=Pararge aegeria TaxID=116150 RepID=UPI0019D0E454|nr:uncharacterized protein LOC120627055 [Pararge aegeria]
MPALAPTEIARALEIRRNGQTYRVISRDLHRPVSTIHRSIQRFRETGTYARRAGQGRKRRTSSRHDRFIRLRVHRYPRLTAVQARHELEAVRGVTVSERTVRRRFEEAGLGSFVPAKAPRLEVNHRRNRLTFTQEHLLWNANQWSKVLFSDECRILLNQIDGRQRIYRRKGGRYIQTNFETTVAYGGGGLGARTDLVVIVRGSLTADRYIREVLEENVVPFAPYIGDDFVFMQDNARPHTARVTQAYLNDINITVMEWPARSPDKNPIEHVWDLLKRKIKSRIPAPVNVGELRIAVVEEWLRLSQETIDNIILSMPRRVKTLIQARGGNMRY